jgi:hypothetical protein
MYRTFFKLTSSIQPQFGLEVDAARNTDEYQKSSWGANNNLITICQPIVYKLWDLRRRMTPWASTDRHITFMLTR